MERAKKMATAFIGVAIAANYCEPTFAQTPSRFIRQPAKAPVNPAPVNPAPVNAAETQVPAITVQSPAAPSPVAQGPVAQGPVAQGPVAQGPVAPSPVTAQAPAEPKSNTTFPSLLPLADSPDLSFDSLESLATVPADLEIGKPTSQMLNESKLADERKLSALDSVNTRSSWTQPQLQQPQAGELQWTSRKNVNRNPIEPYSSNSEPQFNSSRSMSNMNSRANNSISSMQMPATQYDYQASTAAKQQAEATNELLNQIADRVASIETKFEKTEEPEKQDRIRASLVSSRITSDPRFASEPESQSSVTRIESPQGWQAIGARLSDHVRKCESLLGRGAFCSAREEAETASMLLFRHIDLHDNLYRCEPALQSANQALREAEDFLVTLRSSTDGESLRRLVNAHETPILKNKNLNGMSPLTAAQHYRQFAESKLVEAAQGHPWASELLYTIGRTYQAEADVDTRRVDILRMKAMAYYRASRTTMPSNAVACNQLGYLLLQMDRNEEAREALVAAVTLKTDEAFLSNLAEASRRLGDSQTVAWAAQSVAAIRRNTPPPSPVPPYVEVSQEDFIAISPREIGPKTPSESSPNLGSQTAVRSAATPNAGQLR